MLTKGSCLLLLIDGPLLNPMLFGWLKTPCIGNIIVAYYFDIIIITVRSPQVLTLVTCIIITYSHAMSS